MKFSDIQKPLTEDGLHIGAMTRTDKKLAGQMHSMGLIVPMEVIF